MMVSKERCLSELMDEWKKEQYSVSSKAIIPQEDIVWDEHDPNVFSLSDHSNKTSNECKYYRYKGVQNDSSHLEKLYGGVDVSFAPQNDVDEDDETRRNKAVAVYVILKGSDVVYQDWEFFDLQVPYISSYLAFREIEPLERLVKRQLKERPEFTPEAILVDGNGILHCRRAGIAVFLGVRTNIPTIGIGKSFYYNDNNNDDANGECVELKSSQKSYFTREMVELSLKLQVERFKNVIVEKKNNHKYCDDTCISKKKSFDKKYDLIIGEETVSNKLIRCTRNRNDDKMMIMGKSEWENIINILSNYCHGFASKLEMNGSIYGACLVGHGGKCNPRQKFIGTKNPIYVSIGNNISLEKALEICCELSFSRIPEPVRKADLLGRELMRKKTETK